MKRKKVPTQKQKGLFIYCNKCQKDFSWTSKLVKQKNSKSVKEEPICGENGSKFSNCKFFQQHKFRARIYIPGTNRVVCKVFETDNYKEAAKLIVEFEQEVKKRKTQKQFYVFDAQQEYIEFLKNIDVPAHQQVQRSQKHIKEVYKCLQLFNEALNFNGIKITIATIPEVTDEYVGYFHSYLLEVKKYQNKTYNNKMSAVKGFFLWSISHYKLKITNPFDKVRSRKLTIKKETITRDEFERLLKVISPENGVVQLGGKRKQKRNLYKSYLKDGIELALYTGGRREEVVNLKWNMIFEKDNIPMYIEMRNLKVERQLGDGFNEDVTPKIIPITKDLRDLLNRLGYKKYRRKDRYLLNPNRTESSTAYMMDCLSKGFSHFYSLLGTNRKLQLKSLRKTYLTHLYATLGKETKYLSSHTSDTVLQRYYVDEKVVHKAITSFEIFTD
ncbi:tyrosine-type recombinase/integrase [Kordia jejudonensis]|uniref:tyrosine-type recombinase/integrase n=1 Tax=Kordia jejudonensis TaxID=1348245 RepID=UPI00062938A2|nr:tyrosine-type recombinase/integrase [Kordia jejudonensis]